MWKFRAIDLFCVVITLACISPSEIEAETHLYVASDAQPGGDGTVQKPLRTLAEARDSIRIAKQRQPLVEPITVHVAAGVYQLNKSLDFTDEDSGTSTAPIVYRASEHSEAGTHSEDGAGSAKRPRLRGGITLEPAWFHPIAESSMRQRLAGDARDKVLVCDLSKQIADDFREWKIGFRGAPVGPWLYVDDEPMTIARWPNRDADNGGWAEFSKAVDSGLPKPDSPDPKQRELHPGSFQFKSDRPSQWNIDQGVWLQGYWTHDWSDEVIRVADYDAESQVIKLAAPHNYGIMGGTWGAAKRRFFALNVLEELDAPGEWYLDRQRKQLYLYPKTSLEEASIVLATMTQPLLTMNEAKHIRFEGFAFKYGHASGVEIRHADHVEIVNCVVANFAGGGISVEGTNNSVSGCELYHLGTKGLSLNGGDRRALVPAKNIAFNNHIHHYGIFQRTYAPGIGVGGCGQVVRNNCIHDAPHNAILYGGNEHLFEFNDIYRVVMETGDAGAFYTGRDWTSQGNILRYNFIHDLGGGEASHVNTMGVYLDDCDSGDTIQGNVYYRAGRAIMIGGGRDNPVLNNLVIDCPIGLHMDARGMTWKQWNSPQYSGWNLEEKAEAMNYRQPPWSTQYPHLANILADSPKQPRYNPIRDNLFVDCSKQVLNLDGNVKKLIGEMQIAGNVVVNSKGQDGVATVKDIPGFRLISGTESQPVPISSLPGVQQIPFEKIGLVGRNAKSPSWPQSLGIAAN